MFGWYRREPNPIFRPVSVQGACGVRHLPDADFGAAGRAAGCLSAADSLAKRIFDLFSCKHHPGSLHPDFRA